MPPWSEFEKAQTPKGKKKWEQRCLCGATCQL
jgi:hypothetical protein